MLCTVMELMNVYFQNLHLIYNHILVVCDINDFVLLNWNLISSHKLIVCNINVKNTFKIYTSFIAI
jgi:hypothetical protein